MTERPNATELKACCAAVYETDWARLLLGDSFHPGGLALTTRVGQLMALDSSHIVLDAACGRGESALHLAKTFRCRVIGIDLSGVNIDAASAAAEAAGLTPLVEFRQGDAESLPAEDASMDAVLCECAFCTFPDKPRAAAEFARVLRPGGRVGLSDLVRAGPLPSELNDLLAWVACIGDARPIEEYVSFLTQAGFGSIQTERHGQALVDMIRDIRGKLLGAELLAKLQTTELPGVDFERAREMARAADAAVRDGRLGYALIMGTRLEGRDIPY